MLDSCLQKGQPQQLRQPLGRAVEVGSHDATKPLKANASARDNYRAIQLVGYISRKKDQSTTRFS